MPKAASHEPIGVYIVDDHEMLRRGLRDLLIEAGGFDVIGESGSAADCVPAILSTAPQIVLMDVQLPDGSGIDVCRQIRAANHEINVLIVTTYSDEEARLAAALAGANGFVSKQIRSDNLIQSVRRVAAGEKLIPPPATPRATHQTRGFGTDRRLASLTAQEHRVLDLIVDGLTNREIGERLGIGEKTVKNYVTNVLLKLGFVRRTQAAVYGARVRGF